MAWISGAVRGLALAVGLIVAGTGAASACDNCERHDGYHDGRDGYRDGHDGGRDGYHDGRDGWHEDGRRYADACGDRCDRHEDGCRNNCTRHTDGCRDSCGRRYEGCHDGCGRANYSCYSGYYDCRFEDGDRDGRFRARYYDPHPMWTGGGAYGFYGH